MQKTCFGLFQGIILSDSKTKKNWLFILIVYETVHSDVLQLMVINSVLTNNFKKWFPGFWQII